MVQLFATLIFSPNVHCLDHKISLVRKKVGVVLQGEGCDKEVGSPLTFTECKRQNL